ncbi:MAG: hypothetical protein ACFCVG_07215 [Kineosporiaceae bacterium]
MSEMTMKPPVVRRFVGEAEENALGLVRSSDDVESVELPDDAFGRTRHSGTMMSAFTDFRAEHARGGNDAAQGVAFIGEGAGIAADTVVAADQDVAASYGGLMPDGAVSPFTPGSGIEPRFRF